MKIERLLGAVLASGIALVASAGAVTAPVDIAGERVRTATAGASLSGTIESIRRTTDGPTWIAWTVPTIPGAGTDVCCMHPGRSRCSLERKGNFTIDGAIHPRLQPSPDLFVLLRVERERFVDLRTYSAGCPIDAGRAELIVLEDVAIDRSVQFLTTLVDDPSHGAGLGGDALGAIALHDHASADDVLERVVAHSESAKLRGNAAFWIGVARGARGFAVLKTRLRDEPSQDVREEIVFGISQSTEPEAIPLLLRAARRDADSKIRSTALFWLAQSAGERATETLRDAVDDDPDIDVKKQAVFALSQLPAERGVPMLIDVALTHRTGEVRREAMFWLGKSGDPRALELFERILSE